MENNDILAQSRNEEWREALRKSKNAKERTSIERVKMPELDPSYRITCKEEVNQGITEEMALVEASRCLDCPNPQCVTGCPVNINIPGFIKNVERGEFNEALKVIKETSALPAVCGRVCPQEKQCFKYSYIVASLYHVACKRKSCRTATHYCNFDTVGNWFGRL